MFCNRTFHPKWINGEALIKLCPICVRNFHIQIHIYVRDWHIDVEKKREREKARDTHTLNNRRAFGLKHTLGQECLAKVHICSTLPPNMYQFSWMGKKYNHIPSEEFLIRKEHWEWENGVKKHLGSLSQSVSLCVCEYVGACVSVWLLVIFSKLSQTAVCSLFFSFLLSVPFPFYLKCFDFDSEIPQWLSFCVHCTISIDQMSFILKFTVCEQKDQQFDLHLNIFD